MSKPNPYPSPKSARKIFDNVTNISIETDNIQDIDLIFIMSHCQAIFNLSSKKVEIINMENLKDLYLQYFPQSSEEDFIDSLDKFYGNFDKAIRDLEIDLDSIDQIRIHRSKKPLDLKVTQTFFHYSPYRTYGEEDNEFDDFQTTFSLFVKHLMIDAVVKRMMEMSETDVESYQTLPAKFSLADNFGGFLRDDCLVLMDQIYYPQESVIGRTQSSKVGRVTSCIRDLNARGFSAKSLPFLLEGGNMINLNLDGRNIILLSISDRLFDSRDRFIGSHFFNDDQSKESFTDYSEFCAKVKSYLQSLGYDQVVIIDRNLDQQEWKEVGNNSNVDALYHLDTFIGVAGDVLLLPKEALITKRSRQELEDIFGERIILMTEEERKSLTSNFIVAGNNIMFTNSDVSPEIIEQFNHFGFNCLVPPLALSLFDNDGLRCHTQEIPESITRNPFITHQLTFPQRNESSCTIL